MANAIIATVFAALGLGGGPPVTDVEGGSLLAVEEGSGVKPSVGTETPSANVADKSPGAPTTRQGSEATPSQASVLACVRLVESQGNYRAVSKGNTYFGAFQFSRATWASVGGSGNPADASPAEQDIRALALYQREGLSPWPPARGCAA